MYLSFGRTLRSFGKIRIGAGVRLKGWTGAIMLFVYGLLYMCWYMILGMLWLMYGIGYLFFYLPIKGIVRLYKKHQEQSKSIE